MNDALVAARLCARDPFSFGGILLRGGSDEARAAVAEALGLPVRRLSVHIDDDRLIGGLDLGASLSLGRAVAAKGLLAEADGGAILIPMAERVPPALAGRLAYALDTGEVAMERDGLAARTSARFAVLAFDDGVGEERVPEALRERLAFHLDLDAEEMPQVLGELVSEDEAARALTEAAAALGIASMRPVLFAVRAARALAERRQLRQGDLLLAARLVLAPRAMMLPPESASSPERQPDENSDGQQESAVDATTELILAAVRAWLPEDAMALNRRAPARRGLAGSPRGTGERLRGAIRGRPSGSRAGLPRGGARLALIDTLRAAAPWQALRRGVDDPRVRLRRDDLRIRRVDARAGATTIFAVDASGSSALARLAEAKGAVELMLSRAYVDRSEVALIAFRGEVAEILLPPTRSLTRARRALAELPGGGGTPLAAGLAAAHALARRIRSKGRTPRIALLTDGRANIAADGRADRTAAEADAAAAARAIRVDGLDSLFIDIAPRPRPEGAMLASAMGARYLPLPKGDAAALHAALGGVH